MTLKLLGAAYLVYLGVQSLRSAWSARPSEHADTPSARRLEPVRAFRQGVLNDLGNPKMAAFFMGMLPQFVPADAGGAAALMTFLGLGLLFCGLTFAWLAGYSMAIARARRLFERARVRRALDGVAGPVLIGFGVRLALSQRSD